MCKSKKPQVLVFESEEGGTIKEDRHYYFDGKFFVCVKCKKPFGTVWGEEYPKKEYMKVIDKLAKQYGGKYFDMVHDNQLCKKCSLDIAWENLKKVHSKSHS